MSTRGGSAIGSLQALASYPRAAFRPLFLRLSRRGRDDHERAFLDYQLRLPSILRLEPIALTVAGIRDVVHSPEAGVRELLLDAPGHVAHLGDMLYLRWQNDAGAVDSILSPDDSARVRFWSTPMPGVPSKRTSMQRASFLSSVVDLGEVDVHAGFAELLRRGRRAIPRVYTLAGVTHTRDAGTTLRVLVGIRASWSRRAAAWLHTRSPGDVVQGWILPHPHRVPVLLGAGAEGIAVVTGSGIAGILAALRAGTPSAIWLIWGRRGTIHPELLAELEAYRSTGAISRLDLVDSTAPDGPRYVTDILSSEDAELRRRLGAAHWVYVSGHAGMTEPVLGRLTDILGAARVAELQRERRIVVST